MSKITAIQTILGVTPDDFWGPISQAALDQAAAEAHLAHQTWHPVRASSFADPADVAAFQACKASGKSDQQCFAVGDNGIGCWGDDTTADVPMCALPPEDWQPLGSKARGQKVLIEFIATATQIIAELRDTMPHRKFVKNGRGIDLNAAACRALGLTPGNVDAQVAWKFVQ